MPMHIRFTVRLLTTLACLLPVTAHGVSLIYDPVLYAGSDFTLLKGINDYGEYVGEYWIGTGSNKSHGMYSDGSNLYTHDRPGGDWSEAWGINDNGLIAADGVYQGHYSGFLSDRTTYTDFNYPGSAWTDLFDVNNNNQLVGGYGTGSGYNSFIYDMANDQYTWLAVPAAGSNPTSPIGINNSGQVVGSYRDNSGNNHGFYYDGTNYTTIDVPGAVQTELQGLNDQGQMVGYYIDSANWWHGFLYELATQEFTTVDIPDSTITRLYDINNQGVFVGGFDTLNTVHSGFVGSFVPVPPALPLLMSGLAVLAGLGRRRR